MTKNQIDRKKKFALEPFELDKQVASYAGFFSS